MAKISELPQLPAGDIDGSETLPIVKGGKSYRAPIVDIGGPAAARAEAAAAILNVGARTALGLPKLLKPEVLAFDSCQRADAPIGTADTGQQWVQVGANPDFRISGNKLVNTSGSDQARAVIDVGASDFDVTFHFASAASSNALFFRTTPTADAREQAGFWFYFSDGAINLYRYGFLKPDGSLQATTLTKAGGFLPADFDRTKAFSVRCVMKGNLASLFISTASAKDYLITKIRLRKANLAATSERTHVGFYIRTTSALSGFEARTPNEVKEGLANLEQRVSAIQTYDGFVREMTEVAVRERECPVSLQVLDPQADLNLPILQNASDYFRGWINFPGGGGLLLCRSAGYFVVRRPDGTVFPTTLGLTPAELDELNASGPFLVGPYLLSPPRDSNYVTVIEWAKLYNEARIDERGYALKTYTFGKNWAAFGDDKFTGGEEIADGLAMFYPTDAGTYFFWNTYTGETWFDDFGLDLRTGSGGKKYIGGKRSRSGICVQFPFAADDIVLFNPLTGWADQGDFGHDLRNRLPNGSLSANQNKWSGHTATLVSTVVAAPRASTVGIGIYDDTNAADPIRFLKLDKHGDDPNWGHPDEGGYGVNRFQFCPNGKLLGGPRGSGRLCYYDTLLDEFEITDFGYEATNGAPLPDNVLDQIGGVPTPQGNLDWSPSSSTKFLRAHFALSQPTPAHLLSHPVINKGT